MRKKSSLPVGVIFAIVLSVFIVAVLTLSIKGSLNKGKKTLEESYLKAEEYAKCKTYCLTEIGNKNAFCETSKGKISCLAFISTVSLNTNSEVLQSKTLAALGIKKENLAYSYDNNPCKIFDFLAIDNVNIGDKTPSSTEVYENVRYTIEKYGDKIKEISSMEGADPCLLTTIVSIESSGGKAKCNYGKGGVSTNECLRRVDNEEWDKKLQERDVKSCGITMITPETAISNNICSSKDKKLCCKELINNDELALKGAAKLIKVFSSEISKKYLQYPYDSDGIFKTAYLFSYYNGGDACTKPSKSCSFTSCQNLANDPFLRNFKGIPVSMCPSQPGGCDETMAHITKAIYAYRVCKTLWQS